MQKIPITARRLIDIKRLAQGEPLGQFEYGTPIVDAKTNSTPFFCNDKSRTFQVFHISHRLR